MDTATAAPLADGTLVFHLGQSDSKAHPVSSNKDEPGRALVNVVPGVLSLVTEWNRVAPADALTLTDTVVGVEVRKWLEAPVAWQRAKWLLNIRGTYVGTYDTKRDAVAASHISSAVLHYHGK